MFDCKDIRCQNRIHQEFRQARYEDQLHESVNTQEYSCLHLGADVPSFRIHLLFRSILLFDKHPVDFCEPSVAEVSVKNTVILNLVRSKNHL